MKTSPSPSTSCFIMLLGQNVSQRRLYFAVMLMLGLSAAKAATFTVVNVNDSGAGSLRQAVTDANAFATFGGNAVAFNIPGPGLKTIALLSPLPQITRTAVIDGSTQPGYSGSPVVQLNGADAGESYGLIIGVNNCVIRGLAINRFPEGAGIALVSNGNKIEGCYIGTDATGTIGLANGVGVYILGDFSGNTIGGTTAAQRNVLSGNSFDGIGVLGGGAAAQNNTIVGNYIGTNAAGTAKLPNKRHGILFQNAANNTVGASDNGGRNVISGNGMHGIYFDTNTNNNGNLVLGNYIGLSAGGLSDLGNGLDGVRIDGGAGNVIGATTPGTRNVISGNDRYGVELISPDKAGNTVQGNYIGTDSSGTAKLGNTYFGVAIIGSSNNLIGGPSGGAFNLIAGNGADGVMIMTNGATGNVVQNNGIGLSAAGTALGNSGNGVNILTANNVVTGNIISGNANDGVHLGVSTAVGNVIKGNYIGTDGNASAALGNARSGVFVSGATNTIGGTTPAERNIISGNGGDGVSLVYSSATGNVVQGNYIGTDLTGTKAVPNLFVGVDIQGTAHDNTVGGTAAGTRNIISGNSGDGINILNAGTTGNAVEGNYVGTQVNGTSALANGGNGVVVSAASDNRVGGGASALNVIAFNSKAGVVISGGTGDYIANSLFSNGGLAIDLGNDGVTANDAKDADSGANNLLNFPVITSAVTTAGTTTIGGTLNSTPNSQFTVILYSSPAADPSGHGEGKTYLDYGVVTTDGNGDATFEIELFSPVALGQFITALTLSQPTKDVSEFSNAVKNAPPDKPTPTPTPTPTVTPTPTPTATPTPTPVATKLANISTRLRVDAGENVLIGGFIITGNAPKKLIARALGPSLPVSGKLVDPKVEIFDAKSKLVATNDNWQTAPNKNAMINAQVAPTKAMEAAILGTLNAGSYTAVVRGANGGTGVGSIEIYDLNTNVNSELANISARGLVKTADNVMIGGFILVGSQPRKVIVRALGPSLPVAGKLSDPTLELFDNNGTSIATNDNWKSDDKSAIEATGIPPTNNLESAIVATLQPAAYTAIVRGKDGKSGVAVVEVYALH